MASAGGDLGEGGASRRWEERAGGGENKCNPSGWDAPAQEIEGSARESDRAP
jgi:hypothetical protein